MTIIHKRKIGISDGQQKRLKKSNNSDEKIINTAEMNYSETNEENSAKIKDGECLPFLCPPVLPCNYCTIL